MVYRKLMWMAGVACAMAGVAAAQQKKDAPPEQSPRKAIIEMLSGGEDAFKKHLTLEVQEQIKGALKSSTQGSTDPVRAITIAKAAGGDNLESFDSGPILFSYNNLQQHERLEIRIDSDDLRGDEDDMQLSVHAFRAGVEEDLPVGLRLLLGWKLQESVWRLNALTVSASVAVGDPRVFDKSRWTSPAVNFIGSQVPPASDSRAGNTPAATGDRPKMTAARAVRLIAVAENVYARKHPETGFTCFISELVGVGRGLEDGEPYTFMDPEFAQGVYNGYKFSLSGCSGNPVRSFHVMAEPVSGTGRAYCTDTTRDLRGSDDGSGAHCLVSGKIVQR